VKNITPIKEKNIHRLDSQGQEQEDQSAQLGRVASGNLTQT
jgi:hypothetical protein